MGKFLYVASKQFAYFALTDRNGLELWRTDGTASGTYRVKDIRLGPMGSKLNAMTLINDNLYFSANDEIHGDEIWTSDGTEAGTVMLADLAPGSGSSSPTDFFYYQGHIYFSGTTEQYGREVFRFNEPIPPMIELSGKHVAENQPSGAFVGRFLSRLENIDSYQLVSGNGDHDNAAFYIDRNELRTTVSFDYESKKRYTIRVAGLKSGLIVNEQEFEIFVDDVPELFGSPIVGDGTRQRSYVDRISLTFDGLVNFGPTL